MPEPQTRYFAPFHLDVAAERLWRGTEVVRLTPKAFGVLCHLVMHAGHLVTREALMSAVWDVAYVSEGALAVCIRELRQALGDDAQTPQYVETVRGRGYRFVAPVTESAAARDAGEGAPAPAVTALSLGLVVGRETELGTLRACWTQAQQGVRQIVMITGEAGIGKTTLVDVFVEQVLATAPCWLARGQCIEQHGAGEAYLPLLEAMGRIGRSPDGTQLVRVLQQYAPSWLLHLLSLVPPGAVEALERRAGGTTQERMLRELAEAVEVLTHTRPLVLVVEDLHWCDASTLDWLAYVAQRREPARLLVLGTYRPVEAIVRSHTVHAVTQNLRLHGQATEVILGPVPAEDVALYLARRFTETTLPTALARVLHQRTEGNPLFLVTVVDDLVQQGIVRQDVTSWELGEWLESAVRNVPDSLQQLMEQQFTQLSPADQTLLEAASVAGTEFAAAAVAAGMEETLEAVDGHYDRLARQGQFVQACGTVEWPDGTVTTRYRFLHALHREFLYERMAISRRTRWHRQIAERLEAGYGPQARALAVELAEHCVRGRDLVRAVQYLRYAGEQAAQRSAQQAACQHLTRGLALLATLPQEPARLQQELELHLALGPAWIATKGPAAPEVEQTYTRAQTLCQQLGATPQLFSALRGLCEFYRNRGTLPVARDLGTQLDQLMQRTDTPMLRLEAHETLGNTMFFLGDFPAALAHLGQGMALHDPAAPPSFALHHGVALEVRCLALAANTLWCLGYPDQALRRGHEALAMAQRLAHPYSLAVAHYWMAHLYHHRREVAAVQAQAEALLHVATTQGFPLWIGHGTCWHGWALSMQGQTTSGLAQLRQGIAAVEATGQTLTRPLSLVLLAEVAPLAEQHAAGLDLLTEALSVLASNGQGDLLAEAYRLHGACLLCQAPSDVDRTVAAFQESLRVARAQHAKSWELRTALSLARLWQHQGKHREAQALLAPLYAWFTEGFDTADLQEAKALLEALSG